MSAFVLLLIPVFVFLLASATFVIVVLIFLTTDDRVALRGIAQRAQLAAVSACPSHDLEVAFDQTRAYRLRATCVYLCMERAVDVDLDLGSEGAVLVFAVDGELPAGRNVIAEGDWL